MNKPIEGLMFLDDTPSIDPVVKVKDFQAMMKDEAFMQERVLIQVQGGSDENQVPYVHVCVNGMNQIINYGQPVAVRRMFVEVLARMKQTKYTQRTSNPMEPDRIENVATHSLVHPFSVIRDDNSRGFAWLQHILNEPA